MGNSRTVKAMKLFIWLIEISLPVISLLQMVLLIFAPCTPPFIMSMFPNCREITSVNTCQSKLRFAGHILDTWILSHGVYSAAIPVLFVLCAGIISFLTYFNILQGYVRWKYSNFYGSSDRTFMIHTYLLNQTLFLKIV